jgi:serine protease Do
MKFISKFILKSAITSQLLLSGTSLHAGPSYQLPSNQEKPLNDENIQALQKISKGVSSVARYAAKAVAFVSVYKTNRGLPPGMVDPFEFFFGQNGNGGRRGRSQQRPNEPQERREGGLGSGFIIDLSLGYIMTNNHVVQDADEIQIKLANGKTHEAKIIGRDPNTDIAIVQISDKNFDRTGLSQVVLGNSDEVNVGDFAVAVGAPYGLEASVSFGIISALARGSLHITQMGNFIQTDAAINPGNSGGPLLNTSGQVIGMNSAIYSKSGGYNGIGFAVPSNLARTIGQQLIASGKVSRGYIGVGLQPIDPELTKSLNLPKDTQGTIVARVAVNGPAAKAGIEPGDVITAVNKQAVHDESEAINSIGLMQPGSTATISIFRNGKLREITTKIGDYPSENAEIPAKELKNQEYAFGLSLQKLNPATQEKNNLDSKNGLLVVAIAKGGEAERVGIQPGDVILSLNGKPITDTTNFNALVKQSGARALLRIERAGQYFFVPLRNQ